MFLVLITNNIPVDIKVVVNGTALRVSTAKQYNSSAFEEKIFHYFN